MPSGKGHRIVKPLTAKQRAQALAYRDSHPLVLNAVDRAPEDSWWTKAKTREEFDQAVKDQQARMKESAFGKFKGVNI